MIDALYSDGEQIAPWHLVFSNIHKLKIEGCVYPKYLEYIASNFPHVKHINFTSVQDYDCVMPFSLFNETWVLEPLRGINVS